MSQQVWLHEKRASSVILYSLPSLSVFRTFTSPSGRHFRYGVSSNKVVIAPSSFRTTVLEVFDIQSGCCELKPVPNINQSVWPLLVSDTEIIDLGDSPQVISLTTGKARAVLHGLGESEDLMRMGGCFLINSVLLLAYAKVSNLRVFESTLGNYSQTRKVPRHCRVGRYCRPAMVEISKEEVLIYAGGDMEDEQSEEDDRTEVKSVAILYNTKIRWGEVCGKMPGKPAAVLSHAVYNGCLYALLADGRAMVCDLQTAIAKSFALEDWNAVKGVLWAYKYRIGALPISLFRTIIVEYVY